MKKFLSFTLVMMFSISALAGFSVRGGGDEIGIEFLTLFNQALKNIKDGNNAELKKLLKNKFGPQVAEVQVMVVDEPLMVGANGTVQESTAVNYPMLNLIKVNRARWNKIPSLHAKESLVLHEMLSLLELESTGNYKYSALYASQYGISQEEFEKLSVANNIGGCVNEQGQDIFEKPEAFLSLIEKSKSCDQATQLARACAWGSSMDRNTVSVAFGICEGELNKTKGAAESKVLLEKMQAKCSQEYGDEMGTMFMAMEAHCNLSAIEWVLNSVNTIPAD